MAILSASVIIQSLSTTHLILAYFLLTAPAVIADLNLVFILGAAMDLVLFPLVPLFLIFLSPTRPPPSLSTPSNPGHMSKLTATFLTQTQPPPSSSFTTPSPATALLAAVLALSAFSDLTAASLPREITGIYWTSQAPVRLSFFFILTAYSFAFKPGGMGLMGREFVKIDHSAAGLLGEGKGQGLKNSMVFTWGFVEMVLWFWVGPSFFFFLSFFQKKI